MPHALIVEDDPNSLSGLAAILEADGFSVDTAASLADARLALSRFIPDVVLIDLNLPDGKGLDLLPALPVQPSDAAVPVIVMTGNATVESAVEGLRHGIWDYLVKPVSVTRLRSLLARIPRPYELTEELHALKTTLRQLGHFGMLVGRSAAMQSLYSNIDRIAPAEASALIIGESGVGKEAVARTIHHMSRRRKGPFVSFDCEAHATRPIASLLFGQERAAMPIAPMGDTRPSGALERASGGTLYLDDITRLPVEQQFSLVKALQERSFRRVGGTYDMPTDFRVLASTTEDPQQAVGEGRLRGDLHRLLNTFVVPVAPLRSRNDDIPLLAEHFVSQLNEHDKENKHLGFDALREALEYPWPGNVRELRGAVENAYRHSDHIIETIEIPGRAQSGARASSVHIRVGMPLADVEEMLIRATLDAVGGTRHRAASMLGISPKTLYNKLQRMKLT